MKGSEFLQRVHALAHRNGTPYSWHPDKGKGSHGVLKYGDRRTVVRNPKDELKTGTLHAMLKQLGLKYNDIAQEIVMQGFVYFVALTKDNNEGGYVVTCRDLPEAVTQGESIDNALDEAAGALQAAVEMRIEDGLEIPAPSASRRREHPIVLPVATAMKAALYLTMREQGITKSDLARLLQLDEKEARRILDPKHGTKVNTIERALRMLGKRVEVLVS